MNKQLALRILNPILGLLLISQAVSGLLSARGLMPPEAFEIIHESGGIALVLGVGLHLTLNWSWVKASFMKPKLG